MTMMRMPAATKAGGICFAMPDVCLTPAPPAPPVPVPYPNTAQLAQATGTVPTVLVDHKEPLVQGSVIPMSAGDEPGTHLGVVSGTVKGPASPRVTSSKVFLGGRKAVYHTATFGQNGVNANQPMGVHTVASQAKVLIAT
jgi:hypothetical protein